MLDAHCHLDLEAFDADRDAVITRARAVGVTRFVVAGVGPEGWRRQRALAAACDDVWITLGVHPWTAARAADEAAISSLIAQLGDALDEGGVVGLGELGLDRARPWLKAAMPLQRSAFRTQLAMARDRELPLVLHVVRAHGEALDLLEADGVPARGGMVHAFSGSPEVAARYVALGLHVSFCGTVVGPRSQKIRAAAAAVPIERLLVETDAPDLTPEPHRPARNEPAWLATVLAEVADLRGADANALAARTRANAVALFSSDDGGARAKHEL